MRRAIAAVACGLFVLAGVGCQNFSYVQRNPSGGVIELKASDQNEVIAQLQKQEGDIEIETVVPKSQAGGAFNPNDPVRPSERVMAAGGFGSFMAGRDEDKVQIKYRKKGVTPPGLPPAPKDDGVKTAGYQSQSQYERTPGAGMATVGGGQQPSNTALPKPDFGGMGGIGTK